MENWQKVYCILAGEWNGDAAISRLGEGYSCSEAYETAHKNLAEARDRLCERFQLDAEDKDLEEIMNAVLRIEQDIARRAYLWGCRSGAWNGEKKE